MKDQPELEMPNRLDNILSGLAVFVGALLILGGCQANDQRIIVSTHKDFEDLFALVDTIQFDESILIAQIISLDVSDGGQFLVSDYSSGQIHVFSSSGGYEHSRLTESCPSDTEFRPLHARFLGGGRVIASTGNESYLFGADGHCERRVESLTPPPQSYCSHRDTLFTYTALRDSPIVRAYSSSMELLKEYEIAKPAFPALTKIYQGLSGRYLACSDEGVYYLYPESSDARLLGSDKAGYRHRPAYYYAPTRDRKRGDMATLIEDGQTLSRESTMAVAVFDLDGEHRIVAFANSPRYMDGTRSFSMGLNIVSDRAENASGVSTFVTRQPLAAKSGLLYLMGDNKRMDSDEPGNPMIEVWRFVRK